MATYLAVDDENDTGETDTATYTVNSDVPCPQGCTLTQGYWKTHNDTFWGGAPTDETWELIGPLAENEIFFLSGRTYSTLCGRPKGNAQFNLPHQYIAAKLNMLDGADGSAISLALSQATALFNQYTDEQVAAFKGKSGKEIRAEFARLAGILGSHNERLISPGHCDEDAVPIPSPELRERWLIGRPHSPSADLILALQQADSFICGLPSRQRAAIRVGLRLSTGRLDRVGEDGGHLCRSPASIQAEL